jgi:toxin ParE1/3/4
MAEVIIRPEASADIGDIYAYSIEKFGVDVAREYHAGLQAAIMRLAIFPETGAVYPGLRPPVRFLTYRRHHILYDHDGTTVWVARIVHHARDVRHLI